MRNDVMPKELVELERRLVAYQAGNVPEATETRVARAVGEELERPSRGVGGGWSWAAVAVAMLLVLNLSAVWGVKDQYSVWDTKAVGWAVAQHAWQVNEDLNPQLRHGFSTRVEKR